MRIPLHQPVAAVLLAAAACVALAAQDQVERFATVDGVDISRAQYEAAAAAAVRARFYHARPPEGELAAFRREVGERLIDRALLLAEAKRRGIVAERARIDETVAQYDRRYGASEHWRAGREQMLPPLVAELERQNVLEQLERAVRAVPPPGEDEVRAYYDAHAGQFTEPEQVRLSLILLRVDPAAPRLAWDQALEEADRLRARLARGAEFGELARVHSADPSAANGGDLGYLHRGMLPEAVQSGVIDALEAGEVPAPLRLLEGVALVRLEDRKAPRLRDYAEVRARAAELAQRSRGEQAWTQLIAALRAKAAIRVDESVYQTSLAR
jgi:parvulin-like peptidyl-prolyl isomerase